MKSSLKASGAAGKSTALSGTALGECQGQILLQHRTMTLSWHVTPCRGRSGVKWSRFGMRTREGSCLREKKQNQKKKNKSKGWLDWLTLTQGCVRHKRNKEFPHTTSQCVCTCVCVYMHKPHSRCDATDCNRKRGNQKMQSFSDVCHRGALPLAPFLACATNPNQKKMVYMVNMRFCVLF